MEMATTVKIEFEGWQETTELFKQISNDFSKRDATNIMRSAVRLSMKTVLSKARSLVAKDTGALAHSLQVEARTPNKKDMKSKYILPGDVVIGAVTTASGKQLAKMAFKNRKSNNSKFKQVGIASDARATVLEFGTSKMSARPFLRPALESSSQEVVGTLGKSLGVALEKYKAKQAKRALK
jgi:HK97 gp10 family phage protein